MLKYEKELGKMKQHFPSWTDIRKRVDSSIGGAILHSYAKEVDDINIAIDNYKKDFFLLNYIGKEDTIPAFFYVAFVGTHDNITVDGINITTDAVQFYSNLDTMALYQDACIILDGSLLPGKNYITYLIDNTYTYKVKLSYQHVWNVFDEFALFAGIKRYDNEKNSDLSARTLSVFKNVANSSECGLKNAIKNALINIDPVLNGEIIIERPNQDNMELHDDEYKTVYERMIQYNRDLFRAKKWDTSLWQHPFKKLEYVSHEWNKIPEVYQDGIGANESLKVDYIKNINAEDYTSVTASAYIKSEKAIQDFIRNNNIETSIQLDLTKYSNEIIPKTLEYKITSSEVVKIDPDTIFINAMRQSTGESSYYISDLFQSSDGVTKIDRNILTKGKKYELNFTAKSPYGQMNIYKCDLAYDGKTMDLRIPKDAYEMKNNVLVNKTVLAHITSTSDLKSYDNIKNVDDGITMDSAAQTSTVAIDITGMGNHLFNYKATCAEVNITDNAAFVVSSGFELINPRMLMAKGIDSFSNIIINMNCNSYSFDLGEGIDALHQGSINVTTIVNGNSTRQVYTSAQTIAASFDDLTQVKIVIQKNGQNSVMIKNIKAARYKITKRLQYGNIISNPMYTLLPAFSGSNTLYLDIEAYSSISPVINYIHVGNSLIAAQYSVEIDAAAFVRDASIEIDSTCNVSLYELTGTKKILINKDYCTSPIYKNETNSSAYIVLNLSDFTKIENSSPEIHHKYLGSDRSYIILAPGESIERIVVRGNSLKTVESRRLSFYVADNQSAGKEVYISKAENSFIIKNVSTGQTKLVPLKRDRLSSHADSFKIIGIPDKTNTVFIIDSANSIELIANQTVDNFEQLCFVPQEATEYIAYNTVVMLAAKKTEVEIVNTFSPVVNLNKMMFYRIFPIQSKNDNTATALFEKDDNAGSIYYENWSLGINKKGITVTSSLDFNNSKTYELTISQLYNKYIVSSEIAIEDGYQIDDIYHELAEYIIQTPDGIEINYEDKIYEEELIAEADGFNKLTYSNSQILSVSCNGILVNVKKYSTLEQEGIIVWNDNDFVGQTVFIRYTTKKPISLSYVDNDILYKVVKYNVNAYEFIGTNTFLDVRNGESIGLSFPKNPDKVITKCSNSSFQAIMQQGNKTLTVLQLETTNKLAARSGYIYDGGLEYYHFNDRYVDGIDRMGNVELDNVSKLINQLLFRMRSKNYMPNSNMNTSILAPLCNIDFRNKAFEDISEFNSFTACESLHKWHKFNMDISLATGLNGYGIKCESKDNNNIGYMLLDVTTFMKKGNIISVWTSDTIQAGMATELQQDGMIFTKSIAINEEDVKLFKGYKAFQYHIVDYNIRPETRYYIIITGNGTIDDIVSKPYLTLKDMEASHTKNIDKLGLKIEEDLKKDYIYKIPFDGTGAQYNDLEMSSINQEITTSMNVGWGLTKIGSFDFDDCQILNADLKKDCIVAEGDATISTSYIYSRSTSSTEKILIKVNDYFIGAMKGFQIDVFTCAQIDGDYIKVASKSNANLIEVPRSQTNNYVKVEISMKKSQVINSIEIYAKYIERADKVLSVSQKDTGELLSRIYDMGATVNSKLSNIIFSSNLPENVEFYIRGCREDKENYVFTKWYKYNSAKKEIAPIIFNEYRLLQFMAKIKDKNTVLTIKQFEMTVI